MKSGRSTEQDFKGITLNRTRRAFIFETTIGDNQEIHYLREKQLVKWTDNGKSIRQRILPTSLPTFICSLSFSSVFRRDFSNRAEVSFQSSKMSFWLFSTFGIFLKILQDKMILSNKFKHRTDKFEAIDLSIICLSRKRLVDTHYWITQYTSNQHISSQIFLAWGSRLYTLPYLLVHSVPSLINHFIPFVLTVFGTLLKSFIFL